MLIVPATGADLAALAALEREVFAHEIYPPFFFRQAHDLWPGWLWVARHGAGPLSGYVLAAPACEPGLAWLLSAATAHADRGRGVGTQLLAALLETLQAEGMRRVRLTVHPQNPARRLYARHGFHVLGEEPDYFGPGEPRLVLQLKFP